MDDRRLHRRVPLKVPLYVSAEGDLLRKMVPLESQDVSVGGLCVRTALDFRLDADARIVVSKLGDLPAGAYIEGRVVRRERVEGDSKLTVGIQFVRFVNVTQEEFAEKLIAWEADTADSSS